MPNRISALVSVASLSLAFAATVAQAPAQTTRNTGAPYQVNDLGLGAQISPDSAQYRDYRCGPSEQFDGFTWCQKSRQERRRRTHLVAAAFARRQDRLHQSPAGSRVLGWQQRGRRRNSLACAQARIAAADHQDCHAFRRSRRRHGVVGASVAIEPLDGESVKILADGRSPRKGFLVDYLGNLVKSAQDGLPVYRITGGPGLIWVASYDHRGRGAFRVTAVDASVLTPPVAAAPAPTALAERQLPASSRRRRAPISRPV